MENVQEEILRNIKLKYELSSNPLKKFQKLFIPKKIQVKNLNDQ
jgi:hypothetical protein